MSLRVTIHGAPLDILDDLEVEFREKAVEAVGEAADIVLEEVKRRLTLHQGTRYTAAAPGEPPERDTGHLVESFKRIHPTTYRTKAGMQGVRSGVQSRDPGAARLEFGATDLLGRRTYPHPYLLASFAATKDRVTEFLETRLG